MVYYSMTIYWCFVILYRDTFHEFASSFLETDAPFSVARSWTVASFPVWFTIEHNPAHKMSLSNGFCCLTQFIFNNVKDFVTKFEDSRTFLSHFDHLWILSRWVLRISIALELNQIVFCFFCGNLVESETVQSGS